MCAGPACSINTPILLLQKLINQPEYAELSSTEKLALLEAGTCPTSIHLPGCDEMKLNFVVDWKLLQDALQVAVTNLNQQHSIMLDGSDPD